MNRIPGNSASKPAQNQNNRQRFLICLLWMSMYFTAGPRHGFKSGHLEDFLSAFAVQFLDRIEQRSYGSQLEVFSVLPGIKGPQEYRWLKFEICWRHVNVLPIRGQDIKL